MIAIGVYQFLVHALLLLVAVQTNSETGAILIDAFVYHLYHRSKGSLTQLRRGTALDRSRLACGGVAA